METQSTPILIITEDPRISPTITIINEPAAEMNKTDFHTHCCTLDNLLFLFLDFSNLDLAQYTTN